MNDVNIALKQVDKIIFVLKISSFIKSFPYDAYNIYTIFSLGTRSKLGQTYMDSNSLSYTTKRLESWREYTTIIYSNSK